MSTSTPRPEPPQKDPQPFLPFHGHQLAPKVTVHMRPLSESRNLAAIHARRSSSNANLRELANRATVLHKRGVVALDVDEFSSAVRCISTLSPDEVNVHTMAKRVARSSEDVPGTVVILANVLMAVQSERK